VLLFLEESPYSYLDEICWFIYDSFDVVVGESTVWDLLQRNKWSRKACRRRAAERSEALRFAWQRKQLDWRAQDIVCVDESACNERTGHRKFGWSLKGTPCYTTQSQKRSERYSILPAISINGFLPCTLIRQGSITGEIFYTWLKDELLPLLSPGQILVLDNASIHRSRDVKALVASHGIQLEFLPPYSPDFNPIETAFASLKGWVRRYYYTSGRFATLEGFFQAGIASIDDEMAGKWFWSCGYKG
jgi:transposase